MEPQVLYVVAKMISGSPRANFRAFTKCIVFAEGLKRRWRISPADLPTMSNRPDSIMGVHLALLTTAALRCPIGCGLHGATTFPFPKDGGGERTNVSKNISATFCNVSHGADSCPYARLRQQHHPYEDRKVRRNVEAVLVSRQATAKKGEETACLKLG